MINWKKVTKAQFRAKNNALDLFSQATGKIKNLQSENKRLRQALEKAASDVWNSLAWLPTNPIDCKANLEGTRESILKALKGGE